MKTAHTILYALAVAVMVGWYSYASADIKSEIISSTFQRHGVFYIHEVHTDDEGIEHHFHYSCPLGYDTAQRMKDRVAEVEATVKQREKATAVTAIQGGVSFDLQALKYNTAEEIKGAYLEAQRVLEAEITNLTDQKTKLEGAQK